MVHEIIIIGKILLFVISSFGYWELIKQYTKIDVHFLPGLVVAIQSTILFLAGLFNVLFETSLFMYVSGFCLLGYIIKTKKRIKFVKTYGTPGYIFIAVAVVIMMFWLRGKLFNHYDNFTHWAMVTRNLLETDRYPNFQDSLIMFQEYPLGSASYIYYFARFVGTSESIQMLAQAVMMLVSILPLFLYVKKNAAAVIIMMTVAVNFIFSYNISIYDLLVDTLLPLVGMSALIYAFIYCKNAEGKVEFFGIVFYLVQLMQIKNSGIFFVVLICLYIIIQAVRGKRIFGSLICVCVPCISLFLWHRHCNYVFPDSEYSKHAMTIENYHNGISGKSIEEIRDIALSVFKFTATSKDIWIVAAFAVCIIVFTYCLNKKNSLSLRIFAFSGVMFFLYMFGVLGMYLFSMSGSEAINLDGIGRYTKTILIAVIYLCMIPSIRLINCVNSKRGYCAAICISLLLMVSMKLSLGSIITAEQRYDYDPDARNWLETMKKTYHIPEEKTYTVIQSKDRQDIHYFLGKYIFRTLDFAIIEPKVSDDLDSIDSRYIFVKDHDNALVEEWIENSYPDQTGKDVIFQVENRMLTEEKGHTGNAACDLETGFIQFTTNVDDNCFNALALQLMENESGETDTLDWIVTPGHYEDTFRFSKPNGWYDMILKANSNLQDEYVISKAYLLNGEEYCYTIDLNLLSDRRVEVAAYSIEGLSTCPISLLKEEQLSGGITKEDERYKIETFLDDNYFGSVILDIRNKETGDMLATLRSVSDIGKYFGYYQHESADADCIIRFRGNTNVQDEYIEFTAHLKYGETYHYSFEINEIGSKSIELGIVSFDRCKELEQVE